MSRKIDKRVLNIAMLRVEKYSSLCALDIIMRIDDENIGLHGCRDCVFRDMLREEVCFSEVKQEVRGLLK